MEAGLGVGVWKAGLGLSGGDLSAEICGTNPNSLSLSGYGTENQFTDYLLVTHANSAAWAATEQQSSGFAQQ